MDYGIALFFEFLWWNIAFIKVASYRLRLIFGGTDELPKRMEVVCC